MKASEPRSVPFDFHAEEAIIAAAFQAPVAIEKAMSWLQPAHFYLQRHGDVWAAIVAVHTRSGVVDLTSVASEMRRSGLLDQYGGIGRLGEMLNADCSIFQVEQYARIIAETSRRRAMIEAGGQITALGYDEATPLADCLSSAEQRIYQIASDADPGEGFVSLSAAAQSRYEQYQQVLDGDRENPGVKTGIAGLDDRLIRSLKPGQMITLAARPGMGKTALALSIARNLGKRGDRVGFVSMEMTREELTDRLVSMETGLRLDKIVNFELTPKEQALYLSGVGQVADWPIHLDDTAGQSIQTIRARARRLHQRTPLSLLVVDYLQLIAAPAGAEANENAALTTISRGIKSLAMELRIPVLSLAQLNREVEKRSVKTPQLSDLRGSGSIEQDSDVVMFIHREEVYDPNTKRVGIADLIVAKHRNGPVGRGEAAFRAERALFATLNNYKGVEGYE